MSTADEARLIAKRKDLAIDAWRVLIACADELDALAKTPIDTLPKTITGALLSVVIMPNGEVICLGKTVGWFKELKAHLKVTVKPNINKRNKSEFRAG